MRGADPIVVAMLLHEDKQYLPEHLKDASRGDTDALLIVANAAQRAFGINPLAKDGKSGLTIAELHELMLTFDQWMMAVKKNIRVSPTARPSSAATSPRSSDSTTSDSSGSGATVGGQPSGSLTSEEPET